MAFAFVIVWLSPLYLYGFHLLDCMTFAFVLQQLPLENNEVKHVSTKGVV